MCQIFVGAVHTLGKSDIVYCLVTKCFFPIHVSAVSCQICTKNLGQFILYLGRRKNETISLFSILIIQKKIGNGTN